MTASPNPTDGRVKVTVQLGTPGAVSLQLTDIVGRSLENWSSDEEQTVHEFDLSIEQYKSGMYLMTAQSGELRVSKKIVRSQK